MKKILTLDQLVQFCKENKFHEFDSKKMGYTISVQVPAKLEYEEDTTRGLLFAKVKVCHTLLNANGSYISEENMKKAMPTLKYRPLLGYIHKLDDGNYDFHAHDMEIQKDENGNDVIVYKEGQIGCFTSDEPYLEYDEEKDKTYVIANVAIPEEYTLASNIIRRKNGTKVSCELVIESYSYNVKNKYLEINDFYFSGCTCLGARKDGTLIGEGMLGSRLDIEDFSTENNSMFSKIEVDEKLVETLDKLNETISKCFDINAGKEEKLVEENKNFEEEIVEAIEEGTEEVTEKSTEEETTETKGVFEEEVKTPSVENEEAKEFSKTFEVKFEISHNEVRYALYNLIEQFEELDDEYYYIRDVYDTYFVMQGWSNGAIYGCKYSKEEDSVSLVGERYKLYEELLTESEKAELDSMRSNYSAVKEKLENYEKAELDAEKDAIFEDASYAEYLETEDFQSLIKDKDKYSVEELRDKAEIVFAKCIKKTGSFTLNEEAKSKKKALKFAKDKTKNSPYGSIFAK